MRERVIYRPHGLNIKPAIFPESVPLGRMRVPVGNLTVRAALAEKINQLAAVFILRGIRRKAAYPAKVK
jgi:hypothetical protein